MLWEKNSESLIAGGGGGVASGGAVTVTRASATALPPGPVALAMKVVDTEGPMVRLPEASTVPTPLSIVTVVALEEFQERVVDCPLSIADGDALREIVGAGAGGAGGGGGVSLATGGGGAVTFFPQPAPETSKASSTAAAASAYNDLLITVSP